MSENNKNVTTSGGIGFAGLLTIAFIVLKLTGVISWGWFWVLSPIWGIFAVVAILMILYFLVVLMFKICRRGIK
jgi:hypothetical protein|nr:MAG TPA: transmembrane protein [Caudoviricetes sp.]